jgi:hypothetical protein
MCAFRTVIGPNLNGSKGEGFRTPAPSGTVVRDVGPAFGSLPRRKPRGGRALFDQGALWGFWARGLSAGVAWSGRAEIVSIGRPATSVFDRADARREREETRGEALAKLVRTSPSWSGVRPEAKAIDGVEAGCGAKVMNCRS